MIADTIEASNSTNTGEPSLFDQFYAVQVTDDDVLEMGMLLEDVHENLGAWFLSHDEEFCRDILAGARLFWERRQAPCQCKRPSSPTHPLSDGVVPAGPRLLKVVNITYEQDEQSELDEPSKPNGANQASELIGQTEPSKPNEQAAPSEPNSPHRHRKPSHGTAPLVTLRLSRKLSQSGLASLIGIPQATISRIEHGGFTRSDKIREHVRSALEGFFELPLEELVIAAKAGKRATRKRMG